MGEIREDNYCEGKGAYMKATGIVRRIDDLGRIVIPKEIRKTLRIRDGESLEIFLDKDTITLKKFSQSIDLATVSQTLIDIAYNIVKKNIFVTDRDNFIAGSGELKKDFFGKTLSQQLEDSLATMEKIKRNNISLEQIIITTQSNDINYNYLLNPILADGETIGLVMMIMPAKDNNLTEEDMRIIQIISQFLGKYLEE